jgi:hypothetical protein
MVPGRLLLYWPDFRSPESNGQALTPALLAAAAHRHLSLRSADWGARVWVDPVGDGPAAAAFERWGFVITETTIAEPIRCPGQAACEEEAETVILAMRPERAVSVRRGLACRPEHLEVWTPTCPQAARADGRLPGAGIAWIDQVLHLDRERGVGLYVDWSAVERAARMRSVWLDWGEFSRALLARAAIAGVVSTALLHGPWPTAEPVELARASGPPGYLPGRGTDVRVRSDERLGATLGRALDDSSSPGTWVVVGEPPGLCEVVQRARSAGIRVLLWPADAGHVPVAARVGADACIPLFDVLGLQLEPLVTTRRGSDLSDSSGATPEVAGAAGAGAGRRGGERIRRPEEGPGTRTGGDASTLPPSAEARVGPWHRLAFHVETVLREQPELRHSLPGLTAVIAGIQEFGPTPANAVLWLERARSERLLLRAPGGDLQDLEFVRLNPDHPVTRVTLEASLRCFRLVHQMLVRIPWVSFKLLRTLLTREQWLGGHPLRMDEAAVDEWLNFLVQADALQLTREPNTANPEFPVTALRLNMAHPMVRSLSGLSGGAERLTAERVILTVDHFLTRNRKPWMAMGVLRRMLKSLGRDDLQEVLRDLQEEGVLRTDSYPNPRKDHATTGCRLIPTHPRIIGTLEQRDGLVQALGARQRPGSWAALGELDAEAPAELTGAALASWVAILQEAELLEVDGDVASEGWEQARCRLRVEDAVVQTIIARGPERGPR